MMYPALPSMIYWQVPGSTLYPLPSTLYPLKQRPNNVLCRVAVAKVGDLVARGRRIA